MLGAPHRLPGLEGHFSAACASDDERLAGARGGAAAGCWIGVAGIPLLSLVNGQLWDAWGPAVSPVGRVGGRADQTGSAYSRRCSGVVL